ncbi:MAG: adenylate/guanylate cyclase domain-containing protein, partial [Alphaproteobacteria bacterium]|nr:adenylate/guanylate cyclase domain-containing protein [Alphaproteobacteria bacterium]
MERRLAAILAADVVGYSRLMGADEAGVLAALKALRTELFDPLIEAHHGRIVKLMGDGALVEFASVVDAVTCAAAIQRDLAARNAELPNDQRLELRIGVNLGDVIIEGDDLYGDGVNVAARLEGVAEPGGVYVSEAVATQTAGKTPVDFEYLGERRLKNIAEPVKVYRVNLEGRAVKRRPVVKRRAVAVAIVAAVSVVVAITVWKLALHSDASDAPVFDEKAVLAQPTGPTVAVMPFENLSGDPAQEYLAVGISEDIIVELGRYRDLNVLSRQSTSAYRDMTVDIRQIGETLGANCVLEGTVRQADERLRVTARLVDAASGAQVWSGAFDEVLTTSNIFDVQVRITERVASEIGDSGGAIKRIHAGLARAKPPEKLSSYECSLLRVGFFDRTDMQQRIRGCILRVVAEEPDYWRGWAQLAEALVTDVKLFTGLYDGTHAEKLDRALAAAKNAVSLNPESPRARFVLAQVLQLMGDRVGFFAAAEAALALGADRYLEGEIGYEFIWSGRIDFGAALLRRAIDLNPNTSDADWHQALAEYHFIKGEYEAALEEYEKGAQPHYWWSVALEVAFLTKLGRTEEARAARDRLYALRPS